MHFSGHDIHHLLSTYGYWAVMLFVGIESIGIPFPGETMLIAASIYAGTTHDLNIAGVIAASSCGAILGDNIGFWIGREFGFALLMRFHDTLRLDERRLKLGQYLFLKHGGKVVFFGRDPSGAAERPPAEIARPRLLAAPGPPRPGRCAPCSHG